MELNITKEIFAASISTPTTALEDIFNRCKTLFPAAQSQLEKSIRYKVADINQALSGMVNDYICLTALYTAIPSLDLVWTPTGFGVVQNNTLAPASKERVENLKTNTLRRATETKYNLLDALFTYSAFVDSYVPDSFILLWSQYKALAGEQIDAEKFDTLRYKFRSIEWKLARLVSQAELDYLRNLAARQWLTDWQADAAQREVIELIELFVIGRASDTCTADELPPRILAIINDSENAGSFPRYVNSSEYQANNMEPYANSREKPTYFFI